MVTNERLFVRCVLTLICLVGSVGFLPFMVVLKIGEGVWLAYTTTTSSLAQVWAAPGIAALDRKNKRSE